MFEFGNKLETTDCVSKKYYGQKYGKGSVFLFWFVAITLAVWLLLQFFKPEYVQRKDRNGNPTGEVDVGTVVIISLIVAVIVCLFVCLFWGCGKW